MSKYPDLTESETDQQKWAKLVARSWTDGKLRSALCSDPISTLKKHGLHVPEGLNIKVVENDPNTFHLVIPARPADAFTEEQAEAVAGGASTLVHC